MAANSWINFRVPVEIIKVLGLLRKELAKQIPGGLVNDLNKGIDTFSSCLLTSLKRTWGKN